jgi:phosphoribosylanthranilate isomerase
MTMAETMVKICGLTNLQDALWARACGADMLGFIMVPSSPRYVTPLQAARITRALRRLGPGPRGEVRLVGVFADRQPYAVRLIAELCGLDVIQLHGHETAEQATLYDRPVILARRVGPSVTLRSPRAAARAISDDVPVAQVAKLAVFINVMSSPHSGRRISAGVGGDPSPTAQDDRVGAAQDDETAAQPWAILWDTYDPRRLGGSGQAWDWTLLAGGPRPERLIVAGGLTPDNVALAVRSMHPWGVDVSSGVEASPGHKDPALVERFIRRVREQDERMTALPDSIGLRGSRPALTQEEDVTDDHPVD